MALWNAWCAQTAYGATPGGCVCYAVCGTERAYCATRCAVLKEGMALRHARRQRGRRKRQSAWPGCAWSYAMPLRACYALSGGGVGGAWREDQRGEERGEREREGGGGGRKEEKREKGGRRRKIREGG
eukprot:467634-Rhodomonas_salina.1